MNGEKINSDLPVRRWLVIAAVTFFLLLGVCPAMALTQMPGYREVNLSVVNDAGARFDDAGDDTYNFFAATQTETQGMNALHLSTDNANFNYGQMTFSTAQSGVFYMSDTGGRGWNDDGILMLAVNGTVPDNFRVHIRASGYRWAPVAKDVYPSYDSLTYIPGALDEYFTDEDFTYGPQIWKPCAAENYPNFFGQDMADTANTFSIMFIDLNAGNLGQNTLASPSYDGHPVIDNGSIRIEYSFENLHTLAAFNAYSYTVDSNQGRGVRWTNALRAPNPVSGYAVIGQPSLLPIAAFTHATPRNGTAPLTVQFTDQSTGSPTSWKWAYKNRTSGWRQFATTRNPAYTFAAGGAYDINLTATNAAGSDSAIKTGYVSVFVPLPGQAGPPTDPDGDGRYEDLSGNGALGFGDVVLFFKNIETIPDTEPVPAFDFSGNGAVGFGDVVLLFKEVG